MQAGDVRFLKPRTGNVPAVSGATSTARRLAREGRRYRVVMSVETRARQLRDLVAPSLSDDSVAMMDIEVQEGEWETVIAMALSASDRHGISVPLALREVTAD